MSTEVSTKVVRRKATFTVEKVKTQRVFRPVNKRAHKLATKAGKRTRMTLSDLRRAMDVASKNSRTQVKPYAYTSDGSLKAIRF